MKSLKIGDLVRPLPKYESSFDHAYGIVVKQDDENDNEKYYEIYWILAGFSGFWYARDLKVISNVK